MKSHLPLALIATGIVLLGAGRANAQTQQGVVAVLDVKKVFDKCTGFQNQIKVIKQDIKTFEEEFRKEGEALLKERRELAERLKSTDPVFKRTEADLARRFSDLKVRRELKQKEILEQEAALYYDTYMKIVAAVTKFADANGVTLVLRYESKPIEKDNRNEVIQGVNRRVVFQRNRDLTDFIVAEVNKTIR